MEEGQGGTGLARECGFVSMTFLTISLFLLNYLCFILLMKRWK